MDSENGGMLHATTTFLVSFHDFICAVNMQQHEIVPFLPWNGGDAARKDSFLFIATTTGPPNLYKVETEPGPF